VLVGFDRDPYLIARRDFFLGSILKLRVASCEARAVRCEARGTRNIPIRV
jgi:hypothetical protein